MIPLLVHVTQDAGLTVSEAGAALEGLLGAAAYNAGVGRTLLAGPMFAAGSAARLRDPKSGINIRYSSLHAMTEGVDETLCAALRQIEQRYEVAILYGTRRFGRHLHEVLLVDATRPNPSPINDLKDALWRCCALDSARLSVHAEYELYLATALPLLEALLALIAPDAPQGDCLLLAHDWQGLPLAHAARIRAPGRFRTAFYAYSCPTARALIEGHPGHDTRFYNVLFQARGWQLGLETLFGAQEDSYQHALVRSAIYCDAIFAAGDLVVQELRFLGGGFYNAPISLLYHGVPIPIVEMDARVASGERLRRYAEALLGWRPDFVFSHVGPLAVAGGYWRDARVLEHLDDLLRARGERAVLFLLAASRSAPAAPEAVRAWEQQYGWPLHHREGDLEGLELACYRDVVEPFNRRATHTRIVFVNQQGWSPELCGTRMPAGMELADLRRGTDVEFGQSIYEPFGSAQLQPLSAGALCCLSNVCGCVGFAERVADGSEHLPNLVVADYCSLPPGYWLGSPYDALAIDQGVRDWIESTNSAGVARTLMDKLPRTRAQSRALLKSGLEAARAMSWEHVVRDYLLPGLARLQQTEAG